MKTITDKTASEATTRFGLERKLSVWKRPKPLFKELKQLTCKRNQIFETRTIAKNQLHAKNVEAINSKSDVKRINAQTAFFNKLEKEIIAEIRGLIKEFNNDIKK